MFETVYCLVYTNANALGGLVEGCNIESLYWMELWKKIIVEHWIEMRFYKI